MQTAKAKYSSRLSLVLRALRLCVKRRWGNWLLMQRRKAAEKNQSRKLLRLQLVLSWSALIGCMMRR